MEILAEKIKYKFPVADFCPAREIVFFRKSEESYDSSGVEPGAPLITYTLTYLARAEVK